MSISTSKSGQATRPHTEAIRADLHVHTKYSFDCSISLEPIIDRCVKLGIDCLAVADHGTITGALEMKARAPFQVIVAEEILTPVGEIMGLFLTEGIPSGLDVEETIKRIKDQGGLVALPHPFDRLRGINHRGRDEIERLVGEIDVVEVFNSRSLPLGRADRQAALFAERHGLLRSAGSDAHTLREIGHAYVELPQFANTEQFRQSLSQGRVFGRHTCPMVHFRSMWNTLTKRLQKR